MFASIFVSLLALTAIAQEAKPDPREKLDTAIKEAIRLVEAKDIIGYIKQFAHPDSLKYFLDMGATIEQIAEKASEQSESLLTTLKQIKDKKPELSEDGQRAVFKVDEKNGRTIKVEFQKVGKLWQVK